MSKISPLILGLSTLIVGGSFALAQNAATPSIPMVLQIQREYIKPYKSGAAHDKTESAIAAAFAKAKFPAYYVGLNSLVGQIAWPLPDRIRFVCGLGEGQQSDGKESVPRRRSRSHKSS